MITIAILAIVVAIAALGFAALAWFIARRAKGRTAADNAVVRPGEILVGVVLWVVAAIVGATVMGGASLFLLAGMAP